MNNAVGSWQIKLQKMKVVHHPRFEDLLKCYKRNSKAMNKLSPRFLVLTLKYSHQLHNDTDKIKCI